MVASSFGPSYDSAGSPSYNIQVNWNDDTGQNIDTNVSTVTATAYLSATNGGFDGFTCYYYVEINGTKVGEATAKLWGWTGSSQRQFATGSVVVPHNADGSKAIVIKAYFDDTTNTTSYTPKDVTIARTVTLTNLVRPPKAPASGPTLGRTGTGGTISITSQAPASYAVATTATTQYDYRWNNDNGASWTTVTGTSSASFPNFTGTNPALVYYFQTRAINSEGTGPFSPSAVAYAAPSITSASSVGTTATVVLAAPASNGGSTINSTTGYSIDYSTDSAFGTFLTNSSSGVGNNSITGLLPGNTYYFRARYVNAASVTSPYSANASTFIAAYGRRYTTVEITGVTAVGSTTTYTTSAAHPFSVGDPVAVTEVVGGTLNASGTVTAITTSSPFSFTLGSTTPATTSGTRTSGGIAGGWVRMLTGQRYAADAGSGSPGWVPITTAQKFSGSWSSFSN